MVCGDNLQVVGLWFVIRTEFLNDLNLRQARCLHVFTSLCCCLLLLLLLLSMYTWPTVRDSGLMLMSAAVCGYLGWW